MKKTSGIQQFSKKTKFLAFSVCVAFFFLQVFLVLRFFGNALYDKYIYRKSPWHGYNHSTGLCPSFVNSDGFRDREFYEKKPGEYLILVVGDSIVYGQGLLASQRFSNKLEKMLNRIRPTRVFNLGTCGSNIYNHYLIAKRFQEKLKPDLTIITFYENDLLVWDSQRDFPRQLENQGNIVRDFANTPSATGQQYSQNILGAFDESTDNWRMLVYLLDKLPKENTLYFFIIFEDNEIYRQKVLNVQELLEQRGFAAVNPLNLIQLKYEERSLEVSKRELHPNGLANKIFAERLYREITSNPEYGFIQN